MRKCSHPWRPPGPVPEIQGGHPSCHQQCEILHVFEIDSERNVIICSQCYDSGFRFCLFSHEVLHMSQMDQIWGEMYAQPAYHRGQLSSELLAQIDDLYQYLQMIGLENPTPAHYQVNLKELSDE